jgi:tetratricopeptide (TPR) repeat protein
VKRAVFILLLTGCAYHQKDESALLNDYAIYCIKNGLWQDAEVYLKKANELSPSSSAICNNLAVVYEHLGKKRDAKMLYEKAINLNSQRIYYENLSFLLGKPFHLKGKKDSVSYYKIKIEEMLPSAIDVSKVDRCVISVVSKDKQLSLLLLSMIEKALIGEVPFYTVKYEGEIEFEKDGLRETLSTLLADGILSAEILSWQVSDTTGFDLKEVYDREKKITSWKREYYTEREVEADILLSFFDATGSLIWQKRSSSSVKKRYKDGSISQYDPEMVYSIMEKPISSFLSATKPKREESFRWVAKE